MPPQICKGDPPACTSFKAPTAGRLPLGISVPATRGGGGGTDADVPTQPALHAPRRQRPKQVRPRRSISGFASKLQLFFLLKVAYASSRTQSTSFLSSLLGPKEASAATLRLGSHRQQRGQPIHAVARIAHQHRTGPWSPRQPTGKQPHSSALPQTQRRAPQPAPAEDEQPMASSGEETGEGASPRTTVLSAWLSADLG